MKLIIAFLVIGSMQVSAKSTAQNVTLIEKNTPLIKIFNEISRQSGYNFFYKQSVMQLALPVTVQLSKVPLKDALAFCFSKQPKLTYMIVDNVIIVKQKNHVETTKQNSDNTAKIISISVYTYNGKITNENGQPLSGVSVQIKGSKIGTFTDAEGNFSLNAKTGDILLFSYVGYEERQIVLTDKTGLSVIMHQKDASLNDLVIVGYGTQKRSDVSGSISTVKGSSIENQPFSSFDKMLQGKVAGLQSVGGSGQPGSAQDIRIRGIGSISASSSPLYVVDGVPVNTGNITQTATTSNLIAGINPDDIENISVLKDASAASIYGSRAANGVILITTKKGRNGKSVIRLDIEDGASTKGWMSKKNEPLSTSQWKELTSEGLLNNSTMVTNYGLTASNISNFVDSLYRTNNGVNTNWIDVITRTGKQQQANLSIDGGTEKTKYHVSGGYFDQQGVVLASEFKRYSVNLNMQNQITDRFSLSTNIMLSFSKQKGPSNGGADDNPVLAAYFLLPMYSPWNKDGSDNITAPDFPESGINNPVAIADMDKRNVGILNSVDNISAEYKILPGLSVTSKYGVDFNYVEEDRYFNPNYGAYMNEGGGAYRANTRIFHWIWTNLLNYNGKLIKSNNDLTADFKAGYEAQKSSTYINSVQVLGMVPNTDIEVPSAGSTYKSIYGNNSDYAFVSMLALGNISYADKYILSGSFRRDGSSRFGDLNRYGNFWSVGIGWNVDKESFIKNLNVFDQLKLRTSYGTNGNAEIGDYNWRPLYAYDNSYSYDGLNGSAPIVVGNENLTWEINKPLDIGVDVGFFKGRLSATFDWYSRKTTHLLLQQPLSLTSGFGSFTNNIGSMKNEGVEFSLNAEIIRTKDFSWDMNANISHNKNRILSLVDNADQISGIFIERVGEDIQSIYVPRWAGVDPSNGNPLWYTDNTLKEKTSNYNEAQYMIIGSASPKLFGGLGSTFTYKGLSIEGDIYYNSGNLVRDSYAKYTQSDGQNPTYNRVAVQMERWQKPGDITNVPKYIYGGNNASNSLSSRYFYSGDYIRLRNVVLGYQFSNKLLSKWKITAAKIYIRGTNICTWVKDKNLTFDPEMSITSTSNYEVYIPKTYTVGINLSF